MRLLIIGRLDGHITAASKIAIAHGAKVAQVDGVDAGLKALRAGQSAELIMIDVDLEVGVLVASLASERISVPVVAYGLRNDADAAVAAIKAGAKEYIPLPPDPDLIAAVLEAVSEESDEIISQDKGMADILKLADRVAPSDASILITGESGTGKELMARHIHRKSKRVKQIFVSVNCAAIPENLLESELFGHEKGAFTGAVARRIGRFEEASGGTLLLDEVSEMDPRLQAKLLRAIQEREITRVGSNRPIKVDLRLIATTNRDLAEEAANGRFREDLYYRLNVVNLLMPPLRSRRGDIVTLADHFIDKYAEANGVPALPINETALQLLQSHPWRGNVRELENTLHRAVLLATGNEIDVDAIQLTDMAEGAADPSQAAVAKAVSQAGTEGLVGHTVAEVERELILDTLNHCLGNRTHAATILGISIRTLRNKLKQYTEQGVQVPMPGESAVL
jgi:DNA-binding NtrC family response regulator